MIEVHDSPESTLLRCSGRLVLHDGLDALCRAVKSQSGRTLQIELSGVASIDAAGLGVLAELQRWAREADRTLQLLNPSQRVRELIAKTGLSSVLEIRSHGEAA